MIADSLIKSPNYLQVETILMNGLKGLVWFMSILGLTWLLIRLPNLLQEKPVTAAASIATQTATPTITSTATALRATDDPKSTPRPTLIWVTPDPAQWGAVQTFTVEASSTDAPTPTPWPSATPLPTIDPSKASKFSVQNLVFGQVENLNEKLALKSGGYMTSNAWSFDGQWLLYIQPTGIHKTKRNQNPDGLVYTGTWTQHEIIVSSFDGQKKQHLDVGDDPIWSPNGSLVAYRSRDENFENTFIRVIDIVTGKVTPVTTISPKESYTSLAWLSETELLYYQNTVMVFDYTTGQSHPLIDIKTKQSTATHQTYLPLITQHASKNSTIVNNPVTFTPFNGSLEGYNLLVTQPKYGLIAADGGGKLFILQRQNGQIYLRKQIEYGLDNYLMAFSPDGTLLAYAPWGQQYEITITSVDGSSPTVNIPVTRPYDISWSPDSSSLAIGWKYWEGGGIVMVNRDGSGLQNIDSVPHYIYGLTWHPQGTSLTFSAYEENNPDFINYILPVGSKK